MGVDSGGPLDFHTWYRYRYTGVDKGLIVLFFRLFLRCLPPWKRLNSDSAIFRSFFRCFLPPWKFFCRHPWLHHQKRKIKQTTVMAIHPILQIIKFVLLCFAVTSTTYGNITFILMFGKIFVY